MDTDSLEENKYKILFTFSFEGNAYPHNMLLYHRWLKSDKIILYHRHKSSTQ